MFPMPSISHQIVFIKMLLLNINSIWADNQPVASNIIYMGGIHQLPQNELPENLKSYLDSSKHGVIFVSFGTNALSNVIPPMKIHTIIKVLSKLPYDILWKWDKDELSKKSINIGISKRLPQSDLLIARAQKGITTTKRSVEFVTEVSSKKSKLKPYSILEAMGPGTRSVNPWNAKKLHLSHKGDIKLFITQAGLQSTDEAITAGVPLVAIPMLGDQWYNAEKYEKFGIGVKLDIKSFTENQLEKAIDIVIKNNSCRSNVIKLRSLMHDQPETPLNRTMWWTEHVLRQQGAKHLRSPAANISYAEYFEVEVVLVILSAIVSLLIAIVLFLTFVGRQLLSSNKKLKLIKYRK